jgi:hypothetical protein
MSWRDRGGLFGGPPEREEPSWYDTMQVCENGHVITSMATKYPQHRANLKNVSSRNATAPLP